MVVRFSNLVRDWMFKAAQQGKGLVKNSKLIFSKQSSVPPALQEAQSIGVWRFFCQSKSGLFSLAFLGALLLFLQVLEFF